MCHLSNQIDKLTREIPCLRQKLRNYYKDLNKIKGEIISSKYSNFLQIYLKYKNLEIQNSKKSLINKHITAIDSELSVNSIWVQRALSLSSQVIKNGSLNTQQRYYYEQLERHLSNFITHNEIDIGENSINSIQHPTSSDEDGNHLPVDDIDMEKNNLYSKRLRLDEYDLDDLDDINASSTDDEGGGDCSDVHLTLKMPGKRLRTLDETTVLSEVDNNSNATFYMGPSTSTSLTTKTKTIAKNNKVLSSFKSNIVSNILSDQMVKAPTNADQLKNGWLKS